MKKYLFMAASAALVMSSCSSDELVQETPATDGQVAVAFDAPYLTSRAGVDPTDVLDNDNLKERGFGVFAYDQDNKSFSAYYPTALEPNFMNNQAVTGTGDHPSITWTYNPVKYYNNNVGAKHSFFAYAPVAPANAGTSNYLPASGPFSLVLEGVNNGPALHYVMPANLANAVDLCWGEYNHTGRAAIDIEKPGVEHKLNFTFHHALSRVSFNAQLWVDQVRPEKGHDDEGTPTNGLIVDNKTTVTIKSLKLVGTMATEGTLRLYDGVWDAQVATSQSLDMGEYFHTEDNACAYNYVMPKNGGSTAEQPLFGNDKTYLMLLPGGSFQIEITYDVETLDANLPGGKSVVTNTITSDEIYSLNAGQTYQFHLNLGLTSVKFDADIKAWDESADDIHEIDVPANVAYTLVAPAASLKTLAAAKLGSNMTKTDFDSKAVGSILLDNSNKAYERISVETLDNAKNPEIKQVTYPYLLSSDNSQVYVCKADGTYADAAQIGSITTMEELNSISGTTTNGYHLVGGNLYLVKWK